MKVIPTEIPDVRIVEPEVFGDERGYFFESWTQERYKAVAGFREAGGLFAFHSADGFNWIRDDERTPIVAYAAEADSNSTSRRAPPGSSA